MLDKKSRRKNNNNSCTQAKHIILSKIDVKGGKLTYGQRIALGKILEKEQDEYLMIREIIYCLHKYYPKNSEIIILSEYINEIIEGIIYWVERENTMLNYEPSPEEKRAGVLELSKKIGHFGTIKSLAKNYSKEPDEILNWEYGKIFGILYTDLEEYKYQIRYNKEIEKKYK